jgi:hypothetical protein
VIEADEALPAPAAPDKVRVQEYEVFCVRPVTVAVPEALVDTLDPENGVTAPEPEMLQLNDGVEAPVTDQLRLAVVGPVAVALILTLV